MFNEKSIEAIRDELIRREQKVSVAESVTSGLLQAALASADTALKFFEGGITAYNIDQKVKHLHIDRQKGEECNCVSEETAAEMATGACRLFGTDWGIAVTGYATTVPESGFKLFAFYAICRGNEVCEARRLDLQNKKPLEAQLSYANTILDRFAASLSKFKV
jgi:PncC family amidohydrolase